VSESAWNDYDEGYVSAYRWAGALAGGAELPVEPATIELEPGEVEHAHLAAFTLAAFVAGGFQYQPMFGIFVTGEVALGRRAAWRADTRRASAPRWQHVAVVDLVVTDRRLVVSGNGKTGSIGYGETGPVQLVAGVGGGPAVQLRPPEYPTIQLESPWAPLLYVFVRQLVDGRPPTVTLPAVVLERAKAEGRLE
jgi:hypothetical protein